MIAGHEARLTWARENARGAPLRREERNGGNSNSGFEFAQARAMEGEHQGPKRSAFGIPEGFFPDKESGYYHNAASGYYYDADRKLHYHPTTQARGTCATRPAYGSGSPPPPPHSGSPPPHRSGTRPTRSPAS